MEKLRHNAGMTLVEVVITTSLFLILMLVVMNGVNLLYRYNSYTFAQAYQLEHARRGIDNLTRDIREMIYADNGAFPLEVMEPYQIGFYSDIDRDDSVEYVEYELINDTVLERRIFSATGTPPVYELLTPESAVPISEYAQNNLDSQVVFRYFDETGTEILDDRPTDVRYITTALIINVDPVRDPGQYMLKGSAALRNIK